MAVDDEHFREFVETRYTDLLRVAYHLTGSTQDAEDLVQAALVNVMRRWRRVDDPMAYLRRVMINQHISVWRRHRMHEVVAAWVGEVSVALDQPRSDGVLSTGTSFTATADPTDPAGVLAVSIGDDAGGSEGQQLLLVVTPAAATTVRVLRDGQEVARSAVNGSGTAMQVPRPTAGLVVEALDATR